MKPQLCAFTCSVLALFAVDAPLAQGATVPERFYQERFCAGMDMEVPVGLQKRADCVDATYAIEVEFHDKWKEGIGQALAYSAATNKLPGIILVCRSDQAYCLNSSLFVRQTLSFHRIRSTLWDCLPIDAVLADCLRHELCIGDSCLPNDPAPSQ